MEGLKGIIPHLFLPPQLPQEEDAAPTEAAILEVTTTALLAFRARSPNAAVDKAILLLSKLKDVHSELDFSRANEARLLTTLNNLGDGEVMAVKVTEQNAAILITRDNDELLFEAFELSPENKAVYAAQGRLVRTFPATAVSIAASTLRDADFASSIAHTLSTMSQQAVPGMQPMSKKAGSMHEEDRDTTSPAIISELFFSILRGVGLPHSSSTVSKNTREEVLWTDARRPWRRSPTWLLIRVALHLVISRSADGSHYLYKKVVAFILSQVLDSCTALGLPSELYYAMSAKIDRRRQKLLLHDEHALDDPVGIAIGEALQKANHMISLRWQQIQKEDARDLDLRALSLLDFEKDMSVPLPKLDGYLKAMSSSKGQDSTAEFTPSSKLLTHQQDKLPPLPDTPLNDYGASNLQQFEQWVALHLSNWTKATESNRVCDLLCDLLKRYHQLARQFYQHNPEGISVMLLTIFELWMACDEAAVMSCGMLAEYDPEIPTAVLQNLLLPFRGQMERLSSIERYIAGRKGNLGSSYLFSTTSDSGFASRYYDLSSDHQALMQDIEAKARASRENKLSELRELQSEYRRLDALYGQSSCQYDTRVIDSWCDPPETETVHKPTCQKCRYGRERDNLEIDVDEWPLPKRSSEAKTVVFELRTPSWFACWREARFYMLGNVLEGSRAYQALRAEYRLSSNDPQLTKYFKTRSHRIGLLSQDKPMLRTHYKGKNISTCTKESICVDNGLRYAYFDAVSNAFVGNFHFDDKVPISCTYKLPEEVRSVQQFLLRTASKPDGPPPNAVIANQEHCPESMTLEEYKELSTIPLGHRIQWANIILQLAMPGVDFKKPETALVIFQCIYQAGPAAGDALRQAHCIFRDNAHAFSVLSNLRVALQRVKENWESAQALYTFVAIATRIVSLNGALKDGCMSFLRDARAIAINWMGTLRNKAYSTPDHTLQNEFLSKSVEVALICASTFDLDDVYLREVLKSPKEASLLVQASIMVQEAEQTLANKEPHILLLNLRFKRILHRSYQHLVQNQAGLNIAIKNAWSGYTASSAGWTREPAPADHWVTTTNAVSTNSNILRVHYNTLTGELLVNGTPLAQPPVEYRNTALFKTLFGACVVEVMPASNAGFQFSTKSTFGKDCRVELRLAKEQLIVRATNVEDIWESLPSALLEGHYPSHFIDDYVLWYSASKKAVELRPRDDPWNANSALNLTLMQTGPSARWKLVKDEVCLLGVNNATAKLVAQILHPLADPLQIHCMLHQPGCQTLEIELPSVRLGFSLSRGAANLESREYRSMVVDQDQRLGTLIGFANKLILKSPSSNSRLAIILESDLAYVRLGDHVSVEVQRKMKCKVHAVEVDTTLHRLQDSGFDCKLYLTYLHALTSFCLPDPLTLQTGTEQALTLLRSKAVASFDQLSQSNVDRLVTIAALSPGRRFYPAQKRDMQQVDWDSGLGFLSQHGRFAVTVASILRQSAVTEIFYPEANLQIPDLAQIEEDLRIRDDIRSSTFRTSGFGAEDFNTLRDWKYTSRAHSQLSDRAQKVANISTLLLRAGDDLHYPVPSQYRLWELMRDATTVNGASALIDASRLRYDASLLRDGFEQAISKFPALHRWSKDAQNLHWRKYTLTTWLATLSFAEDAELSILQLIALCFKSKHLAKVSAPEIVSFTPSEGPHNGQTIDRQSIRSVVVLRRRPLTSCPEYRLPRNTNEKHNNYQRRRDNAWNRSSEAAITQVVNSLMIQWRCQTPVLPNVSNAATYIDMDRAMEAIKARFGTWYDNSLLFDYSEDMQRAVERLDSKIISLPSVKMKLPAPQPSLSGFFAEENLFSAPPPLLPDSGSFVGIPDESSQATAQKAMVPLLTPFVGALRSNVSSSTYEKDYVRDLEESLDALILRHDAEALARVDIAQATLEAHLAQCSIHVDAVYSKIAESMCSTARAKAARQVQQSPRLSPSFLLKQLSKDHWRKLSKDWQNCIVKYALALTALQRAQRLVKLGATSGEDLIGELRNVGHTNWNPHDYPESLLIEVEGGIMIREVQEQIAREMRSPSSNSNAVCQLNMGQGKSSVIVPIVAAALADSSQLARVVVAKPQSKQMAQMLISKLGGLVNRRVYFMPFSRSLKLGRSAAEAITDMLHECMNTGGILLVQPEHILSFKLMAPECYISGKHDVGEPTMSTQDFLDRFSRDIVDESDENFSTRFELIYTMGTQRSIELSPDRWFLVQHVLDLVREIAPIIVKELPDSIEVCDGVNGSFSRVRLLRPDAEALLVARIASQVCEQGLASFHLTRQSSNIRKAVYAYITKPQLSVEEIKAVEDSTIWTDTTQPQLLMLRGLLAGGVLAFTLGQKRWRVNYGLATRTPPTKLAVPYRAKDSPSPRSEFSHPDVVITLTSLCYYYEGLSDDDLFTALGHLMESDQADSEYQAWVKDSYNLSSAFKQLQGINLKDKPQCTGDVFPSLRYGKTVIDYFLSHVVFPKEMKEFPHKLSASGWDLGKARARLTTGFSGTNDSRRLLPLDINHLDLKDQKHTNALVLEYLLQPQNGVHLMSSDKTSSAETNSNAHSLLSSVMRLDPPVQVILDVGAQILELNNLQMARAWLERHTEEKQAVVFIDDNDEICVVDRQGTVDLLRTSSYQSRLDACLVFLDEAHTRGIDLRLPKCFRAALTLGAHLTKDRLVQAAMRLRKLGQGQTVVFCIPEEIQTKILETSSKGSTAGAKIEVADVLAWSISETHADTRRNMPLWAVQGERFVRQDKLWKAAQDQHGNTLMTVEHATKFLEDEAQTIEHRYRPRSSHDLPTYLADTTDLDLRRIAERCREFDDLQFNSGTLQEEQERELAPEIEQERQVQRAPPAQPAKHLLHPDVERFAMRGELTAGSNAYYIAFTLLRRTSAEKTFPSSYLGTQQLIATADYAQTVERKGISFVQDSFLRPVQWILTRCANGSDIVQDIMIISPFEANELYHRMGQSKATTLLVYKPRANSGYAPLDVHLHTISARPIVPVIPLSLSVQLDIFSGQLYFSSYKHYFETCRFLGLSPKALTAEMEQEGWEVAADGFILRDNVGQVGGESRLKKSPVGFLKALMSMRRNGDGVSKTQVGGLLDGKLFQPSEFEE
ncbi:Hypothetical predicted protein [Lecanosticta acicola]|uniref:ubiquitinyl hydrolase 1 n=1 Tax=Lecanosticta acicola TaxID=111012 RepID=A0AAI8YT77_9PEZI|nr:Hypothetical predicted protein [Lecanosticta acicola]